MDLVQAFIDERCTMAPGNEFKPSVLHKDYKQWCKDRGERAMGLNAFGPLLDKKGYSRKGRAWFGLRLNPVRFAEAA
jgi:phage/plasmid-associated DNA primase